MSKRSEIRARRKSQRMRKQVVVISIIVVGALFVAAALILPTLRPAGIVASPTPVVATPRTITVPVDMTTMGNPDAAITIDIWIDFQCPACARFSELTETQIIQNYVETGIAYIVFHHFPFIDGSDSPEYGNDRLYYISSQYGPGESDQAANASMCAAEQGHFWTYHDTLFLNWNGENQGTFTNELLLTLAESIGLDMDAFRSCFEENRYEEQIQEDFVLGTDWGVSSTPNVFVNGVRVTNSQGEQYVPVYEDVAAAIETARSGE